MKPPIFSLLQDSDSQFEAVSHGWIGHAALVPQSESDFSPLLIQLNTSSYSLKRDFLGNVGPGLMTGTGTAKPSGIICVNRSSFLVCAGGMNADLTGLNQNEVRSHRQSPVLTAKT